MIIKFNLTKKHIKVGIRKNCEACPVALCMYETLVNHYTLEGRCIHRVTIGNPSITIYASDIIKDFSLPYDIAQQIKNFDNWQSMTPQTFELDLPLEKINDTSIDARV